MSAKADGQDLSGLQHPQHSVGTHPLHHMGQTPLQVRKMNNNLIKVYIIVATYITIFSENNFYRQLFESHSKAFSCKVIHFAA